MDKERLWLGLPLATVPQDILPSCKTVLWVLHGLFSNNMKQYRENSYKISCPRMLNSNSSRCEEEVGCSQTLNPCLLYQVMQTLANFFFINYFIKQLSFL